MLPLGIWLALTRPARPPGPDRPARQIPAPALVVLAIVVGCVGGIYGIGGGAILAPVLIGSGRKPSEVAPAALASTFVTSAAGVIAFTILSLHQHISVAPDWPTGIALGLGGLADEIDTAIGQAVTGLRQSGYSWAEIGSRLGITRQAAQQRWGQAS